MIKTAIGYSTKDARPRPYLRANCKLGNFSDCAFDCPKLTFEEIAKKLSVNFAKAKNGKTWDLMPRSF